LKENAMLTLGLNNLLSSFVETCYV